MCSFWSKTALYLFFLDLITTYTIIDSNIAYTNYGHVLGTKMKSRAGKEFFAFRGIPYAKPPIGELRFKNPEDVKPWVHIYNATRDGPICVQKNPIYESSKIEGQEDCLYLNVYSPSIATKKDLQTNNTKLPVIVYVHGGGWLFGSGSSYDVGPTYIIDHDVILVTFNYRLGVFGFLSTGTDEAIGNWGMRDMLFALKWVHNNIQYFNGDSNSVTLVGQSAGAASIHYMVLSNLFKGLFHSAIIQSGSALTAWAVPLDPRLNIARIHASFVNCNKESTSQMIDCLRAVDAYALVEAEKYFKIWDIDPLVIHRPSIEKRSNQNRCPFIEETPLKIIQSGQFSNKVPLIIGVVENEGAIRIPGILTDMHLLNDLNNHFDNISRFLFGIDLSVTNSNNQLEFWNALKTQYNINNCININNSRSIKNYLDAYSDRAIIYPSYQTARYHSRYQNVYFYNFKYHSVSNNSYIKLYSKSNQKVNYNFGAVHCDELIYMFDSKIFPPILMSDSDFEMSFLLLKLWTNFAKFKNPTASIPHNFNWTYFTENAENFLEIEGPVIDRALPSILTQMKRNLYKERMQFWSKAPLIENTNLL